MTTKQINNNRISIGQRLAQLRKEKGLTQQQVADLSGVLRPHIARLEAGKSNVGLDILSRVVGALGGSIAIVSE